MITTIKEPYQPVHLKAILHPLINRWFFSKFKEFSLPQLFGVMEIHQRNNVLISAPTGATKCLTPDETVLIQRDGFATLTTGESLIAEAQSGRILQHIEQSGKLVDIGPIQAYSLKSNTFSPARALVYYEDSKDTLLKIKTEYGKEVKISREHPLLTETRGWIRAAEIQKGEKIAVPKYLDLPEKEIELEWKKAILNLKSKAKISLVYEDYIRLKKKTRGFKDFSSADSTDFKELLLLARIEYKEMAKELQTSISMVHRILYGKTQIHKAAFVNYLRKKLKATLFEKNRIIYKTYGTHSFSFCYPKKVDVKIARWLAFILAEGLIGDYKKGTHLLVSQKNRTALLREFISTSKEYFDVQFKRRNEKDYVIYSTLFCYFVTDLFSTKRGRGRYVEFPVWLLNCRKNIKHNFLHVFFSLEAHVTRREIKISQSNKMKIEMINYLLLDSGIFSSIGKSIRWATNTAEKIRREYYTLAISQIPNLRTFLKEINIDHPNKRIMLEHIKKKRSGDYVNKHRFDYKKIRALAKYYQNNQEFDKDLGNIYEVVRRTGYITEEATVKLMRKIKRRVPLDQLYFELEELRNSKLLWLKIKEISHFQYSGKVFDLTVPGIHNFVGGYGGIVLHNTLTGFLAILNELVDSAKKQILEDKVYAVYVSPLKALSNDISVNLITPLKELDELNEKKLGIRIGVRTGDTTQAEKSKMLKNPPHILITTPESLAIMINSPKFKENLMNVQWLIIDEIHALADNKRGVHLSLTVERLQRLSPGMTRVGLSATIAPLEEIAQYLVGTERDCQIVDVQYIKEMDLQVLSPVKSLVETDYMLKHNKMYELIDQLVQEHKTTLIFTNTRSATERVVHNLKEMFPRSYHENIAAHHGSLSKSARFKTEQELREGNLKVVVSSTSLELGIDIGYVDLVICLGSPKSVARLLQRAGRAGHKLHSTVKARIIVMDRDDLVECSLLLKAAKEKKIDHIHIPQNALDVLAQQIYGIAINEIININELYALIKNSYCYRNLEWNDFFEVIRFLAGKHISLEERHVYSRIWYDEETGNIGKKGKLARVIYMTNIGTIPEETYVQVKVGEQVVGMIDEAFLEKLRPGDVFVLGGNVYMFKFSRGMTAQVSTSVNRPPNVPSWFSEMLPLSYDLAMEIQRFRYLMEDKLKNEISKEEIKKFIGEYLYIDEKAAESIYCYFNEQYQFSLIPSYKKILIENYSDRGRNYVIFHTLFGRRVNDCLSRALAYIIGRQQHRDVEIGINDNGFYLSSEKTFNSMTAFEQLKKEDFRKLLEQAIERSEVLQRRFRHCAARSLMILREYLGRKKNAGRMQIGSRILYNAVKRISNDFPILKEARREVLEDLMDYGHAQEIIDKIIDGKTELIEMDMQIPSPFAFGLITDSYSDIIKIEDKQEFLRRMHQMVLAKIALKEGKSAK